MCEYKNIICYSVIFFSELCKILKMLSCLLPPILFLKYFLSLPFSLSPHYYFVIYISMSSLGLISGQNLTVFQVFIWWQDYVPFKNVLYPHSFSSVFKNKVLKSFISFYTHTYTSHTQTCIYTVCTINHKRTYCMQNTRMQKLQDGQSCHLHFHSWFLNIQCLDLEK